MNLFTDPNRIPRRYGLRIAAGLIAYFLIMYFVGIAENSEYRLLNVFILLVGVYFALKKFKETHANSIHYFRALAVGLSTSVTAATIFGVFLFVFLKLDSSLMLSIQENEPMGQYLNAYIVSFIAALEGVFSGMLVTFIIINFMDTDSVNKPVG